ncbi:MAG: PAS domain S-box protein [Verrucomicrobiaceae bacterium]|nr:PAS domain S-box protein [Verrucomicrobiaceae bacterium]
MTLLFEENQGILEIMLDGLADSILVVDSSASILFANKAVKDLFELTRDPVGRDILEVVRNHRIHKLVLETIESKKPVTEEIELTSGQRDTGQVVLSVNAEPLPGFVGDKYFRVILRDDTHRVETEQVRRDFVANASHELRTPLSIINGYIENLREGAVEDSELAHRFLGIMKKHGDRIARIVEDMLTISKFESAAHDPTKAGVFDLQSCAHDVVERLHPLIEEKQANITVTPENSPSLICGDRFYWDQIFFNLVENALKQNVRTGLNVKISFHDQDTHFRICISDDGVGIPMADLPFIFKRFYRVEKHHSKEIKGTGLGLSIVKRAIESHGGTVEASSTPGKETAFVIHAPKGDVEHAVLMETESEEQPFEAR